MCSQYPKFTSWNLGFPSRQAKGVISLIVIVCLGVHASRAEEPILVGNETQVMWDDFLIASKRGITFVEHAAHRTGEKLIVADQPWEDRIIGGPTIIKEEKGKFRLWYNARSYSMKPQNAYAYAESLDGIHWTKPKLGLIEYAGSKENNLVVDALSGFGGGSVWIDGILPFAGNRPAPHYYH